MADRRCGRQLPWGLAVLLCAAPPQAAQAPAKASARARPPAHAPPERIDTAALARIREEALGRSHAMDTVRHLADIIGSRLTGSPALKLAQAYVRDRLREAGVATTALEPWGPFGRGWTLEGFAANLVAPNFAPLLGVPRAWSPSTAGLLRGEPVLFDPKTAAELERYRGKLKGRIVLAGGALPLRSPTTPQRLSEADLQRLAEAPAEPPAAAPKAAEARDFEDRKWRLLYAEGPAAVLEATTAEPGALRPGAARALPVQGLADELRPRPWDLRKTPVLPQVALAVEPYNRLVRLASSGAPLKVEVQVVARFHDEEPMAANLIGEIPGGDLKDEVVLLGAPLDSWHTGTGAADAADAAVAVESLRVLQAAGLRPRRTIRLVLWSGARQGALGVQAYAAARYGRRQPGPDGAPRWMASPEHSRVAACFELGGWPGRIRGLHLQGHEPARPILQAWLAALPDLGASTLATAPPHASGHQPLDAIGLPAFAFLRDFADARPPASQDVYDRVQEDDLKQSAAVAASLVWLAATRDQKLPRKTVPGVVEAPQKKTK